MAAAAASMPAELLLHVFRSLDTRSRGRVAQVSRRWRALVYDASLWTMLQLRDRDLTARSLRRLAHQLGPGRAAGVTELTLGSPREPEASVTPCLLQLIAMMPRVTTLHLAEGWCDQAVGQVLAALPALQSLTLERCAYASALLWQTVQQHTQLRELRVLQPLPGAGSALVSALVRSAALRACLSNLVFLGLEKASFGDTSIYHVLRHCTALQTLSLLRCTFPCTTGSALPTPTLPFAASLLHLHLDGCVRADVRDLVAACIPCSGSVLQTLSLPSTLVDDATVAMVARRCAHSLRLLNLSQCQRIGPAGFAAMARLHVLQSLLLFGCGISDRALLDIVCQGALPSLRFLSLGMCHSLTDTSLLVLARVWGPRLHRLHLYRLPGVSARALALITANCSQLQDLNIRSCPNVDEAAMPIAPARRFSTSSSLCDALPRGRGKRPRSPNGSVIASAAAVSLLHFSTDDDNDDDDDDDDDYGDDGDYLLLAAVSNGQRGGSRRCDAKRRRASLQPMHLMAPLPRLLHPAAFASLTTLDIASCVGLTDCFLAVLATSCTSLRTVCLDGLPHITDSGVAPLVVSQPRLTDLSIQDCRLLGDATIACVVRRARGLESLAFGTRSASSSCLYTDRALAALATAPLSDLRRLAACSPAFTDAAVRSVIVAHSDLTHLCLSDCQLLTDDSIAVLLNGFPRLGSVDLTNVPLVSEAARAALSARIDLVFT